ncbi:MAG TPA: hypothetical protein VMN36_12665 [Verrucomicrobiales bacterium]|nr:hypothetical protein [Verrucomicrobiales bacterium]
MNKLRLVAVAGLVLVTLLLGVQLFRIEQRLVSLESYPAFTPPPLPAAGNSIDGPSGPPSLGPESLETTVHNLLSDLQVARAERTALRQELEELREQARQIQTSQGAIDALSPDFPGIHISQRERIERWEGGPKRSWGHEQAAGEPDTHQPGDIPSAWASKRPDGGEEWIQLDYDDLVDLHQVNVVESHNPGAISKVSALLPDGSETTIWEGALEASAEDELVTSEFHVNHALRAQSIKVYLDTTRVSGWNEIDAVQLIGRDGSKQWASASSASSSFADP